MADAGQALLYIGGLVCVVSAAIFVMWFADKLRRDFLGTP
jgi:hypothetical protein